jgi:hypothetical protein
MNVKFYDDIDPVQEDIAFKKAWKEVERTVTFDQPLAEEALENMRKHIEAQRYPAEEVIWMWRREWEEFVKLCKEAGID